MAIHLDKENISVVAFETSAETSPTLHEEETSAEASWETPHEWHLNAPQHSKRGREDAEVSSTPKFPCGRERRRSGMIHQAISNVYAENHWRAFLASECIQGAIDELKKAQTEKALSSGSALELLQGTIELISDPICNKGIINALNSLWYSRVTFYQAETSSEWISAIEFEEIGLKFAEQTLSSVLGHAEIAKTLARHIFPWDQGD